MTGTAKPGLSELEGSEGALESVSEGGSPRVRDELADLLRRDLLGPWGGELEVLVDGQARERSPRDRYIVGLLAPADAGVGEDPVARESADDGDLEVSASGDEGDESAAARTSSVRFHPSSLGLSFAVDVAVGVVTVGASWGRYEQVPAAELVDSQGTARDGDVVVEDGDSGGGEGPPAVVERPRGKGWRRVPVESGPLLIDLTEETGVLPVPGQHVVVRWRSRVRGGLRLVSVWLVNRQTEASFPGLGKDAAWMFQAQVAVTAGDGRSPVFVSRPDLEGGKDVLASDAERDLLEMLYRNVPEYAVGHGVATAFEEPAGQDPVVGRRAWRLTTDALPAYDVPQTVAPQPADVPGFDRLLLDMRALASGTAADAVAGLAPLADSYREWLDAQRDRVDRDMGLAGHAEAALGQIGRAREAADRIQAGLDLLLSDPRAWQAFRFANEAMALQRQHTEAVRARREDPDLSWRDALAAADAPAKRSWRPFQIAFVLINLPALTDPGHPERSAEPETADPAVADLLFFPTGGGKTEAYLGLAAFTFAVRRLQGEIVGDDPVDSVDGGAGTAVLMRYTLRLLTAQQFQRAAALVCATEVLRRRSLNSETPSLGTRPFTLGLWVGGSVTPNSYTEAEKYVNAKRGTGRRSDAFAASPLPLRECPWCGAPIEPSRDITAERKSRRVVIYCGDTTGRCEFTARRNRGHGLPIVAVDEQIYREPPTLLIATVDKFAQLPWNGATGHLFGRVTRRCERHGYKHPDMPAAVCSADSHRADGELPKARTVPTARLRPPDLVIQDELHLISGALGTMVGLYETAIDELSTWTYRGSRVRAKVVASTATIRRAREQGFALFRRELVVFPPPVIDVEDSFFARQLPVTPDSPGRRYLGVCATGLRLKATEIRVTSATMGFAQMLFDREPESTANPADPYMTLVAYFNALRELGGMRRLVDDDIRSRLTNPNHEEMDKRYLNVVEELTSRVPSDRIPDTLKLLETRFGPDQSSLARRTRAEERKRARGRARRDQDLAWPVDVLLATNMFAVGVDVSRLGLMSMTGMPKSTAEYIQATSRVGRDPRRPGLVVTVFNWARPRDLSHYERFGPFHAAFYQQVEALSVTPFSLPALERGLTGSFLGTLRNLDPAANPDAGLDGARGGAEWDRVAEAFAERAAAVTSDPAMGTEVRHLLDKRRQDLDRQKALSENTETLTYRGRGDGLRRVLRQPDDTPRWGMWTAPNSLRETEPDINLVLLADDPAVEQGQLREFTHPSVTQSGVGSREGGRS